MFKLFNRKMMKASRLLFFMGTTALCVAAHADETISANVTLDADADWSSKGKVTIEQGVKVNLNGHKLTVSRLVAVKGTPLTDLTQPDGAVSTSTTALTGDIGRVFNDKPTNDEGGRIDVNPSKLPLIVDYDFGEGNEKVVDMYKVYCHPNASLSARCPKTWYFYGSNDGINWTQLDARLSETGWSSDLECRTKTFANTTAYRYYRIKFTANNGDGDALQITQLEYFSAGASVDSATIGSGPIVDLTRPDGMASTPTTALSGDVGRVFNDKPTNNEGGRIDVNPSKLPLIVDYDFGEGSEEVVNMYRVYCHPNASLSARCPKTWYFYGSNDGINWTELDARLSETGWSSALESRTKTFENTTAYRYYRIKFTANNGDGDTLQITQLEYFSTATIVDHPATISSDSMVDLTQPGGVVSTPSATWGDGFESGTAHRLFNNKFTRNDGRFAVSKVNGQYNLIVDYDFGEGNEQVIDMYKVYAEPTLGLWSRCPKSWAFYGSNDGTTWAELHSCPSETGWSSATVCRTKTFENTTAYRYYRFEITANNGDGDALELTQLEYCSTLSAGELHWDIPAGTTVDNKNVEITEGVRLVKDGAGTFVASRPNQTYYGGTHVVAGTFKCGAGTLAGELGGRPFVVVETNGIFDVNGWKNIWNYGVTLAGGTLTNSGYDFGLTDPQISKLKLTADSYITAPHNLGFINSGNGVSTLDLGGNTLYISFDQVFRFVNAEAVSSGVINIVGMGDAAFLTFANVESRLQEVGLDITGRVSLYSNVKAGDLRLNANTICFNQSSFKCQVYGKLALLNDAYYNIELQDGATLDFSGRTSPLNVVSQLENQQLTFVPDAMMTLDLGNCQLKDFGDYKPGKGRKVIEWTETPSDLQARQFKVKVNGKDAHMVVTVADDGLYLWSGMMIYIR